MPKSAHYSITQVRPGTFCIRLTPVEFRPGQSAPEVWVVRVEGIPDGTPAELIGKRLAYVVDPHEPPAVIGWSELVEKEQGG